MKPFFQRFIAFISIMLAGCGELEIEKRQKLVEEIHHPPIFSENVGAEQLELIEVQSQSSNNLIRIIVKLKTKGNVTTESILKIQDTLLSKLSDKKIHLIRRYLSLPMIALDVDKDTYQLLKEFPEVESVNVDMLSRPM